MSNFSAEEVRGALKQYLIEKAIKQSESLKIEELCKLPEYVMGPLKGENDPENYYYVRVPNENPSARHMLDGQIRYILISKITGKVEADNWDRW